MVAGVYHHKGLPEVTTSSPWQLAQGAGVTSSSAPAPTVEPQPAAAAQPAHAQAQQPPQATSQQPGATAGTGAQAGSVFGDAPPGIDPAMWASLDAATASAIQAAMFGADSDDGMPDDDDMGADDGASAVGGCRGGHTSAPALEPALKHQ